MHRRHLPILALLPLVAGCAAISDAVSPDPNRQPVRVVFFNEDSDTLDEAARAIVRGAADVAKGFSEIRVNVFGYAGPAGGAAFNRALSDARARHVATLLRQYGVPSDRVFVLARGPVPFEAAPVESRRVEIRMTTQTAAP